jgi:ComF family protein
MNLLEKAVGLLAPHACLTCGSEGSLLCSWCFNEYYQPVPSRCYKCSAATKDSAVCAKCRRKTPLKHVWVCTEYKGLAKHLIHAFKFERAQAAAPVIAAYMQNNLPYIADAIIVPVPTATSRIRQRGYDHAELIATSLARKTSLKAKRLLRRHGQARQVGTKRAERARQLQGAFYSTKPEAVKGRYILLVDDVLTTGATLEETATVLKKAGADQVDAIVFAQKR